MLWDSIVIFTVSETLDESVQLNIPVVCQSHRERMRYVSDITASEGLEREAKWSEERAKRKSDAERRQKTEIGLKLNGNSNRCTMFSEWHQHDSLFKNTKL